MYSGITENYFTCYRNLLTVHCNAMHGKMTLV